MAWTKLSYTDAGAPSALCLNGSLNNILRWALPLLGWAVEFGPTGNASVFRAAAGNRHRLHVRHDSAVSGNAGLAYVRGAHTATSATAIGQPFPTAGQAANAFSTWRVGIEDDPATPAPWFIYGNDRFFYLLMYSNSYGWEIYWFGDVPSDYATGYETVISIRNNNSPYGSNAMGAPGYPYPSYNGFDYWARGINATTVSVYGARHFSGGGNAFGRIANCPAARGGYQNRVVREKVAVSDFGSATTSVGVLAINRRGWLPNLWNPVHNGMGGGTLVDGDTFTDTVYNAAAVFRVFDSPSYGSVIIEETDTWVKP